MNIDFIFALLPELPKWLKSEKKAKSVEEQIKTNAGSVPKNPVAPASDAIVRSNEKALNETQKMLQQIEQTSSKRKIKNKEFQKDPKFICDSETVEKHLPAFQNQLEKVKGFDSSAFLSGSKGAAPDLFISNQRLLEESVQFVKKQAEQVAKDKGLSLEDAYKLVIGILDTYDDSAFLGPVLSTFALRSAVLLASQRDGVGLPSWMVYTKSGKPDSSPASKDLWPFLDNWMNWVPEAQGAMLKFAEASSIKAKELAAQNPTNQLLLLKGGFGAGKTRLANQVMPDNISGVIAPDAAKRVVRRASPEIPHASAHIQGSQIAYRLFDELIQRQTGTLVYDSSLSLARDVSDYLTKSKKANKQAVIYDIARHDMARSLAVLKRDVGGDDPRIPPDFIITSAVKDKLNRAECMKIILNASVEKEKENLSPEYHFLGADERGTNAEEILLLKPGSMEKIHVEMEKRLALEGIEVDLEAKTVSFTKSKEELEAYFASQFERPVQEIMQELSHEEKSTLFKVFNKRVLIADISQHTICDAAGFYEVLPENIKKTLPKAAFERAFEGIKPETRAQFFKSWQEPLLQVAAKIEKAEKHLNYLKHKRDQAGEGASGRAKKAALSLQIDAQEKYVVELQMHYAEKKKISYLNLPLRTALTIHHNLQSDPWL